MYDTHLITAEHQYNHTTFHTLLSPTEHVSLDIVDRFGPVADPTFLYTGNLR